MEENSRGARIVPGTEAEPKRARAPGNGEESASDKDAGAGM